MMKQKVEEYNEDSEEGFYNESKPVKAEIIKKQKKDATQSNAAKSIEFPRKQDSFQKSRKTKKIQKRAPIQKKKTRTKKEQEMLQESQGKAEDLIDEMERRFKKDATAFGLGKMACEKFMYLDTLASKLRNVYIGQKFLELNGLESIEMWLEKSVDREGNSIEPSIAVKKCLFKIILHLNIQNEQLSKVPELYQSIRKNLKSRVPEIRDLTHQILKKWKQREMEERMQD